MTLRVAVVGAGVAGTAAALALTRQGLQVHVFESVAQPGAVGAGLLLQPTGLDMLRQLGLLDDVLRLGAPVQHLYGDTPAGRAVLDMRYASLGQGQHGLGVQRAALMAVLWRALRGSSALWHTGADVRGFVQDADGVSLQFQGGHGDRQQTGRFDLLVLASGSFSTLRTAMRVRQHCTLYPWGALWCLLPLPAGWATLQLRQRYRAAREMLGVMPVGRAAPGAAALATMFWSMNEASLQAWRQQPDLDALTQRMRTLWPDVAPLLDGLSSAAALRVARYADVWMDTWNDGRVVAIGDCAHGMSPQLGQGANMGLIDAVALAQAVADSGVHDRDSVPRALHMYSQRRRRHIRFYQRASHWLTPLFQSHGRGGPWLRDLVFGFGGRLPYIESESVAALSGLKSGLLRGRITLPMLPGPQRSTTPTESVA